MDVRDLQQHIHSNFSIDSGEWADIRAEVLSLFTLADSEEDFGNHLIREFNRKINDLQERLGALFVSPMA